MPEPTKQEILEDLEDLLWQMTKSSLVEYILDEARKDKRKLDEWKGELEESGYFEED